MTTKDKNENDSKRCNYFKHNGTPHRSFVLALSNYAFIHVSASILY